MSNEQKKILIYTTPTCHFCHMAKDFFDKNDLKYQEFDVLTDVDKRQEMIEKSGQMGVPVIIIGEEITVGFDEAYLSQLLGI